MPVPAIAQVAPPVGRPGHHVLHPDRDLLVAAGTPVGLGGAVARDVPDRPFAVSGGLDPLHTPPGPFLVEGRVVAPPPVPAPHPTIVRSAVGVVAQAPGPPCGRGSRSRPPPPGPDRPGHHDGLGLLSPCQPRTWERPAAYVLQTRANGLALRLAGQQTATDRLAATPEWPHDEVSRQRSRQPQTSGSRAQRLRPPGLLSIEDPGQDLEEDLRQTTDCAEHFESMSVPSDALPPTRR